FVRRSLDSSTDATLDTGGWLALTRQGLSPCKMRRAFPSAITIGPRLRDGSLLILTGTDNDYSVTQNDSGVQFDVYVDFQGNSVQRDIDQPSRLNGVEVGPVPGGYVLIPGVLYAYKAMAGDLPSYVKPDKKRRFR
ncbi:MAG: esterase-like activity of phytase family protein, partial [Gammaproteobacteria bacterium]